MADPITLPSDSMSTPFRTALTVGQNLETMENTLMKAYSIDDGKSTEAVKARDDLATLLGVDKGSSIRSLQLIAEQRYQHGSQVLNMFSGLLDKIDQLKQRLISKFSN